MMTYPTESATKRAILSVVMAADYGIHAIKRLRRPMRNDKSFHSGGSVIAGIVHMHMIRKGQFAMDRTVMTSFSDQF
jgi:hypothetical protein